MKRLSSSLARLMPGTTRARLIGGAAVIVAAISAFMWLYFPARLEREALGPTIEKAVSMADMAAYTLSAAVVFDDGTAVLEIMEALRVDARLTYVVVTDALGRRLGEDGPVPAVDDEPTVGPPRVCHHLVQVAAPVMAGHERVGTVAIGFDLLPLRVAAAQTRRHVAVLAAIVFVLGVGGVGLLTLVVHRLEAHQRQLEERLVHAQKMEAVGRLAGGIAHDFNNLLTTINGTAAVAYDSLDPDSPARRDVAEILSAGERAAALTSQLLAFSRRQLRQPRVLDLNATIQDMAKMLHRLLGETVTLRLDLSDLDPYVRSDPGQLDQVLMNLAVNAGDAMEAGGELRIETSVLDVAVSEVVGLDLQHPGRYAVLRVSDTGHGMDEATLSRLFEPFFTTKEVGKGTGLGLSTVYGIVRQNDGAIHVTSAPGEGSTFTVLLPLHGEPAVPWQEPQVEEPETPVEPHTILLVEDEDGVRKLIARVLRRSGYNVLEASNGLEGLDREAGYGGEIDALVTDVVMPEMSGPDLAAALRETRPGLKVLFMSGYTRDEALSLENADHDSAFLAKPMSPQALTAAVNDLLRRTRSAVPTVSV